MLTAELAAKARHYGGIERRLFEVLGGWAPAVPEPEVKVALRVASFRHAWHAELWEGLVRAPVEAEAGDGAGGLVESLAAVLSTGKRLEAYYGDVLPRLVGEYEALWHRAEDDVAAGGPLRRVLSLVLADDRAELAAAAHGGPLESSEGHQIDRADGGS
ncbi:MAG: hypothetical protein ACLGI2_10310 [Acidimicrobiia bacterium]